MTRECGLKLCIGADAPRAPGFLRLHSDPEADVTLHAPYDLPFPDRAADVIVCAESAAGFTDATLIRLLLECRRVLRPEGVLRVDVPRHAREPFAANTNEAPAAELGVSRLAVLVGLEGIERAPVAAHCRAAVEGLPPAGQRSPAFLFTKRDRQIAGDPWVSILIPAYNPSFFAACLDSALNQTSEDIEIVVCDDSPGDAIEDMVRARSERRPIRYERNPVRLGVRANHRRCFERARGEFVKFLCDDDLLAPNCVARLLDAFRQAPDVALATSHRQLIDAEGRNHPDHPATEPIVERDALIAGHTLANAMLMAGLNVIGEPTTTLFRRADLLDQAPDYFHFNGVEARGIIDMVMWSTLLLRGDAVYFRDSLSCFRIHPGQRQHDPAKRQRNIDSIGSLRSAWQALGLHERLAADQLLAKRFPPPDTTNGAVTLAVPPTFRRFVSPEWKLTM